MIPKISDLPQLDPLYAQYLNALKVSAFKGDVESAHASRLLVATDNSVYQRMPQGVIFPKDNEDISIALKLRATPVYERLIITPRGGVAFEAAAPKLIIEAHRLLEKSTLSKWQQYWKDQVGNWYGMFLHESQYLEPVMPDIEAMLTSSQRNVNGTAILKLRPFSFQTVGVDSPDDLTKSKLGEYGEMQHGWTAEDAKGFIKVSSTPLRVYYGMHPNEER